MFIKVRVRARAKKESLEAVSKNHLFISVKEKTEQNLANRRVIEIVAEHFGVRAAEVQIITGHRSPSKMLSVG